MKKSDIKSKAYEDILHLPHHVSPKRPQMSLADRAAQFSPFAAVVGHESAVKEAARHTDSRKALGEVEKNIIDDQLREIESQFPDRYDVEIIYFKADEKKSGGSYISKIGSIKKLDIYLREILMFDGMKIAIDDIYSIEKDFSKI